MRALFDRFISDESGATAIEYALIGTLISVAIMVGAGIVGNSVASLFNSTGNKVSGVSANVN